MSAQSGPDYTAATALVTGANSGLGYEAAAQLAEAGYGRVILACRTLEKAEGAKASLAERVGRDPFETIAIDVANVASSNAAADQLIAQGWAIDALLLNAGMVPGETMDKTAEGLEMSFAASVMGHHVLTLRLLEAGRLEGARIVLAGSEAANNDLPAMMDMKVYDFASGEPTLFGDNLREAMLCFAQGGLPEQFAGTRQYATTKVFSAWWAGALARRHGDKVAVFTVSPGANMGTNAARHTKGFKRFLFTKLMPLMGPVMGMDQPVSKGAGRYIQVLHDRSGHFKSGRTYTSAPKKMVGPLHEVTYPHLSDQVHQDAAWGVLAELAAR